MRRFSHWVLAFLQPLMVDSSLRGWEFSNSIRVFETTGSECPDVCSQLHGQRSGCHACPNCQWYQRTQECQERQFQPDHAHHKSATKKANDGEASVTDHFCDCASCTRDVWDRDAHGFSCGFRIHYYTTPHGGNRTMEQACSRVATRFPQSCLPCMPDFCNKDWDAMQKI